MHAEAEDFGVERGADTCRTLAPAGGFDASRHALAACDRLGGNHCSHPRCAQGAGPGLRWRQRRDDLRAGRGRDHQGRTTAARQQAAVQDPRARDQALRTSRPTIYSASIELSKVLNGETEDSARQQAARRVLHGQDPVPDGLLRRVAGLLRPDRPEPAPATATTAPPSSGWRRCRGSCPRPRASSRRSAPTIPRTLDAADHGRGPRRALLPARPPLLPQGGDFDQAITLFQSVQRDEPVLHQGQVLRGRHLRPRVQGQAGGRRLQGTSSSIGRGAAQYDSKGDIDQFVELANLQLARVFYSTQQYDLVDQVLREAATRSRPTGSSRCSRPRGPTS